MEPPTARHHGPYPGFTEGFVRAAVQEHRAARSRGPRGLAPAGLGRDVEIDASAQSCWRGIADAMAFRTERTLVPAWALAVPCPCKSLWRCPVHAKAFLRIPTPPPGAAGKKARTALYDIQTLYDTQSLLPRRG